MPARHISYNYNDPNSPIRAIPRICNYFQLFLIFHSNPNYSKSDSPFLRWFIQIQLFFPFNSLNFLALKRTRHQPSLGRNLRFPKEEAAERAQCLHLDGSTDEELVQGWLNPSGTISLSNVISGQAPGRYIKLETIRPSVSGVGQKQESLQQPLTRPRQGKADDSMHLSLAQLDSFLL